jgi:hypothetical protein
MTEVNFLVKKGLTVPKGSASTPSVIFDASDPNTGLYSPGADQVAVATNGSGRLFVDASGNVGIANSSPTNARLLVGDDLGAITTAARMVQVGHPSGGMLILGKDNTDYSYLTHEASTQTSNWFYRGGAGITLNSAGLVGVGTSSPSYKLHVVTDAISGRQDPTNISRTSGNLIRFTNPQFSTDASMGLLLRVFPDADSRQGAGIIANGGTNNGSTTLDLFYTDTAGTSKSGLRISDTGAVGIGVTSPSTILDIVGAGNPTLTIRGSDGAYSGFVNIQSAAGGSSVINATGGANALTFQTNSTERARIDSSGRLLVGTSSARENFYNSTNSARFQIEGSGSNDNYALSIVSNYAGNTSGAQVILAKSGGSSVGDNTLVSDGNTIGQINFQGADGTEFVEAAKISAEVDGTPGANDMPGRLVFSTTAGGASSTTERMRIGSNGAVAIGTTSTIGAQLAVVSDNATKSPISTNGVSGDLSYQAILVTKFDNNTTTSQNFIQFQVNNGAANCGRITANGANTAAFGSTSDIRLKENIEDLPPQLQNILNLRPVEFDYTKSEGGGHQIGFIAQEMQAVYPDVVNERGEDDMLMITGWSKTEARLVKAIQEQQAMIAELQAEVAALKAQ